MLTSQTNPSFGSSAVNDTSARLGRHSFAKAVVSGPFDSAGLKCSFHFSCPLSIYRWQLGPTDKLLYNYLLLH